MKIEDGKGTGYSLAINKKNELKGFAITESEQVAASKQGDGFNINTGAITGLTAGDATLVYFKNDEDEDIVITAIAVGLDLTGGTGQATITLGKDVTGGDLLSDQTAVAMNANRNLGSSKTLKSTSSAYKGKAAGTVTMTDVAIFYSGQSGRLFASIDFVLEKGSTLGMKVTSNATGGEAYAALILHKLDPDRVG